MMTTQITKLDFTGQHLFVGIDVSKNSWKVCILTQHVDCIVVNPADVPTIHKERTFKTDRIDARKLARALRNGELTPLYVPNRAALEDRSLIRTRHSLVRKQTRCKNQIKGLLGFYSVPLPQEPSTVNWSKRFIVWLEQLTMQSFDKGNAATHEACLLIKA